MRTFKAHLYGVLMTGLMVFTGAKEGWPWWQVVLLLPVGYLIGMAVGWMTSASRYS